MGDFERTFGAGADAVSIVDGYAREREKELHSRGSRTTQTVSKTRSLEGATIFADLGSGLKLVKASIEAYYDEAIELDRDGGLYGDYSIFNPDGTPLSPSEAKESLQGFLLLVLRDSYDITQALVGIFDDRVGHLLGVTPRDKHLTDLLFSTFKSHNWTIGTGYSKFGWVTNQAGKWFSVSELPSGFTVSSNFYLRDTDISVLPEEMTVGGDLSLSGAKIENLPDRLTVGGELDLERTTLKRLPGKLTVGGDVFVGTYKVILPSQGSLTEDFDPHEIPFPSQPSVTIGGNLRLDISALEILPRGATVVVSRGAFRGELVKHIEKLPAGVMYMQLPDDRWGLIKKSERK